MSWWRKKKDDERPLRAQLIEALDNIRREIEILNSSPTIGGMGVRSPNNGSEIAMLEAELKEIEAALANLPPDEP